MVKRSLSSKTNHQLLSLSRVILCVRHKIQIWSWDLKIIPSRHQHQVLAAYRVMPIIPGLLATNYLDNLWPRTQLFYIGEIIYTVVIMLVKSSILLFYVSVHMVKSDLANKKNWLLQVAYFSSRVVQNSRFDHFGHWHCLFFGRQLCHCLSMSPYRWEVSTNLLETADCFSWSLGWNSPFQMYWCSVSIPGFNSNANSVHRLRIFLLALQGYLQLLLTPFEIKSPNYSTVLCYMHLAEYLLHKISPSWYYRYQHFILYVWTWERS
jgi:hypothetical protein